MPPINPGKLLCILLALLFPAPYTHAQSKAQLFTRDSIKLRAELAGMSKADQKYRTSIKTYKRNQTKADSIDRANAVRMIAIINTYGFPSVQRIGGTAKNGLLPHISLVHAPASFHDTLKTLLIAEKQAGRISQNEYAHVIWHIDGRIGSPEFEGVKKVKKKKGRIVIHF